LLLLNLAAQVRITELPWVAAAAKFRSADTTNESKESILKAAREVLQSWPGTILPNRLLSQFNSITNAGGLGIDFVEELAVDIFCDMLSPKFTKVAAVAIKLVSGTVYAKYYFIPELGNRGLMSLCNRRVKALQGDSQNYMMRNRLILEQVQILTTHNLATLVLMGLTADWEVLAVRAWTTTRECLEKQLKLPDTYWAVHVKRLLVKNAAWAWRQAIFFLAMAEKQAKKHADKVEDKNDGREVVRRFIRDARAGIPDAPRAETKETSPRLDLILDGLASVLEEADTEPVRPKRIFLGWLVAAPWVFMNDEQLEKLDASSVPLSQVSVALV
jgi:hypothetical protein